jgi:hypothetical protein
VIIGYGLSSDDEHILPVEEMDGISVGSIQNESPKDCTGAGLVKSGRVT